MKNRGRSEGWGPETFARLLALFCLLALLAPPAVLAQCSLCREAVASTTPQTREAINVAIIGLALTPFGVAAAAAWALSSALRARVREGLTYVRGRVKGRPS
jgi:hypothetical protein